MKRSSCEAHALQMNSEVLESLESAVLAELVVAFIVEAFDGGILDGSVHPLDLIVGPRILRLGRAVLAAQPTLLLRFLSFTNEVCSATRHIA